MRLTPLLSLVLLVAVAWAALATVRENAVVVNLQVGHALNERFWIAQLDRQTAEQNRIIAHYRRGELPPISTGPVETEPRPLPEWAASFVRVETVDDGERYRYRQTVGRALASVPAWFFHGTFALGLVFLASLALVEARRAA